MKSEQFKSLRERKGFSQAELANQTRLNIRTIQRIESGETNRRGDTLRRLSEVLSNEVVTGQSSKDILLLMTISQLSVFIFPVLGLIVPMAIWVMKKDQSVAILEEGKQLLNFQITWFGLLIFLLIAAVMKKALHLPVPFNLVIISSIAWIICFSILVIFNCLRIYRDKPSWYPISFNIFS